MVLVTDKKYFMEADLVSVLDLCIERRESGHDSLIIIDGKERIGKSELARQICYYISSKSNQPFSNDNIFFDLMEMLTYATNKRKDQIVWDESAFGGLGTQWQEESQQVLTQMMMTCGKYGHIWIFICPSFFKLNAYFALHRSIALLHVYSPNLIDRGYYTVYNEVQKTYIYNNNRKTMLYGKGYSFLGRFNEVPGIIDLPEYERKKDNAILTHLGKSFDKNKVEKLAKLQWQIASHLDEKKVCEITGAAPRTVRDWRKHGDRYGFGGGKGAEYITSRSQDAQTAPNEEASINNEEEFHLPQ